MMASMCSESSRCGNVSIKYPFFVSNTIRYIADHNYDAPPYACGYTDMEISCEGEGPTGTSAIRLDSERYTVLLADSDVLRPGRRCPAVSHGVSFGEVWLRYSTSSNGNLTFLLRLRCRAASIGHVPNRLQRVEEFVRGWTTFLRADT